MNLYLVPGPRCLLGCLAVVTAGRPQCTEASRRLLAAVGRRRGLAVPLLRRLRELRRRGGNRRVVDRRDLVDQPPPLLGLEDLGELFVGRRRGAVLRRVADMDVVGVVGHRECVVGVEVVHQRDDLVRLHRPLQLEDVAHQRVGDRARALVAVDGDAVDLGDVDGAAGRVLADVAGGRHDRVPALQRRDREPVTAAHQVLEQGEDAAVDLPRLDVLASALIDFELRVGEHPARELLLGEQQDLADRGGVVRERVLAGDPVDRGRLEQLPAVEDRLRVDPRGAAAGRPDREVEVRRRGAAASDSAEQRSCDHLRPLAEPSQLHRLAVEPENPGGVGAVLLEVGEAAEEGVLESTGVPVRVRALRPLRKREQPVARVLGVHRAAAVGARPVAFAAVAGGWERVVAGARAAFARRGVGGGDVAEPGVGVAVAVGVLENHVAAEAIRAADPLDDAVVDGDHRSSRVREDPDPAARRRSGDRVGDVPCAPLARLRALQGLALGDVVGVAGIGGDREAGALGEASERADEVGGERPVLARVEQHLVDVPVGVVVSEDRGAEVLIATGRLQVASRGADRVDRVVGVLAAVVVGVDAVGLPGGGQELHPAEGAGGRDVEVGPERGLDPVDRGEHLPRDPVLGSAGLVDRQQEGRDRELVDDEVGDAERRRSEVGDREPGVGVVGEPSAWRSGGGSGGPIGSGPAPPWSRPPWSRVSAPRPPPVAPAVAPSDVPLTASGGVLAPETESPVGAGAGAGAGAGGGAGGGGGVGAGASPPGRSTPPPPGT